PASVLLKPGQQAGISGMTGRGGSPDINIKKADMEKVMAWKNGLFNFEDARLKEVMRQLARWYDLEIVYEKGVTDIQFWGKMSRNIPLSDVLNGLKESDVHFRMEAGKRLVVLP